MHPRSFPLPVFTQVPRRGVLGNPLKVGLLLDHRLRWPRGGYGVGVAMVQLPLTVFTSKDIRSPQSVWGDLLISAILGPGPLYPHNVGKLRGYIFRYDLRADEHAITAHTMRHALWS